MHDAAGTEKEERFKEGMIKEMEGKGGCGQECDPWQFQVSGYYDGAKPHGDNADIFNAAVGKKSL
jgi:hypothetical protein